MLSASHKGEPLFYPCQCGCGKMIGIPQISITESITSQESKIWNISHMGLYDKSSVIPNVFPAQPIPDWMASWSPNTYNFIGESNGS